MVADGAMLPIRFEMRFIGARLIGRAAGGDMNQVSQPPAGRRRRAQPANDTPAASPPITTRPSFIGPLPVLSRGAGRVRGPPRPGMAAIATAAMRRIIGYEPLHQRKVTSTEWEFWRPDQKEGQRASSGHLLGKDDFSGPGPDAGVSGSEGPPCLDHRGGSSYPHPGCTNTPPDSTDGLSGGGGDNPSSSQ